MPMTAYAVAYGTVAYAHRAGEVAEPAEWAALLEAHRGEEFEWGNVVDRLDPDDPDSTLNYLTAVVHSGLEPNEVLEWVHEPSPHVGPGVRM